jgi:uncharacterized membrane protein YcaP (DUF421 family)
MEKDQIRLSDWYRILFGEAPLQFLTEVIVRTLFIYLILLIVIRVMGKRMSGQLTSTEMAVMLTLGAIVSVPMQDPTRGVLQGVLLLGLILLFQKTLTGWMTSNNRVEDTVQGTTVMLVKDGVLQLDELKNVKISREQLFAVLRGQQIYNLGKVKRVYLEACGEFSIYKAEREKPGLSILPEKDDAVHDIQQKGKNVLVCFNCGNTLNETKNAPACPVCENNKWQQAII